MNKYLQNNLLSLGAYVLLTLIMIFGFGYIAGVIIYYALFLLYALVHFLILLVVTIRNRKDAQKLKQLLVTLVVTTLLNLILGFIVLPMLLIGPIPQHKKGPDDIVKNSMWQLRAQADLYNQDHGAYDTSTTNDCSTAKTGVFSDPIAKNIILSVQANTKSLTCRSASSTYAVSAVLKETGTLWCVDSNGNEKPSTIQPNGLCI